jgi:small-conductance mechanosensitive channel
MRLLSLFVFALLMILQSASFSFGQSFPMGTGQSSTSQPAAISLPENLTPETIRELVSKLSDTEVRSLLLERLDAVAKTEQTVSEGENFNVFELLESWGTGVVQNWQTGGDRLPMFAAAVSKGFSTFVERRGGYETLMMLLKMGLGILLGLVAYFFVMGSPLRRWVSLPDANDTLGLSIIKLFKKLALDLVAIMAFLLVSIASHRYFLTLADRPLVEGFMTTVIVIPMCVAALGRFLMSPYRPEARLVHIDDASALYFQRQQIAVAVFAGFTYFIIQFLEFQGIAMSDLRVSYALNLILFIWIGIVVYRGRDALTMMMLGGHGEETRAERWVAERYSTILLVMLLFVWLVVEILGSQGRFDVINSNPHYYTIILLGLAPAFDMMVRALVRHMVGPIKGEGLIAERAYKSTKRSYIRIGRIIVFSAILLYLADKWSIDLSNLASAGLGAKVASSAVEFLVVAAIGYMVWELVTLWFNRKLAAEMTASGFDLTADEPGGGEGGGVGGSRLSTVLPLLRMTLQTAIIVMTLLIGLGNVGIDITPLLAGAGIVGIAIGFGAQALVRDVVSGIFFLIDDAFRVGEYLVIEDTVGTVEKISLRSMQLRHHKGPVHTIPYGEIPKVTNNSRDWVIMKLKFTFPFETDANKIKKIFKKIGAEMLEAEYAGDLLQTFKSQGVYDVDDVGVIIRGKFMAKPGTQWVIRKDVYNRIQKALDEAGIQFARKEVRVQVPGLDQRTDLTDSQKNAIAAAASEAAQKPQV